MADFIRQLADEAGRTSVKASCSLRRPGESNGSINDAIRRKGGRGSGSLNPDNLDSQIRKTAAANNIPVTWTIRSGSALAVSVPAQAAGGRRP